MRHITANTLVNIKRFIKTL